MSKKQTKADIVLPKGPSTKKPTEDLELSNADETEIDNIDSEEEIDDEEEDQEQEQGDDSEDEISSDVEQKSVDKEVCIYENAKNEKDSESDDGDELIFDDDEDLPDGEFVDPENRKCRPILYNYERVRLLGDRTKQLTLGAKPMIKQSENLSAREIAELELKHNVMPLIIIRELPSGKKEKWHIHELQH